MTAHLDRAAEAYIRWDARPKDRDRVVALLDAIQALAAGLGLAWLDVMRTATVERRAGRYPREALTAACRIPAEAAA